MPPITCTPKSLPKAKLHAAAALAFGENPGNRFPIEKLLRLAPSFAPTPDAIAVLRGKYWGKRAVRLSVSFLDGAPLALRRRIVEHMNAWQRRADVAFTLADRDGDVRIARLDDAQQGGYWSYVGTDILAIDADQPTMNLEGFTLATPESEFRRVVRHEAGHTLGFVHEHMRSELVARIDREKAFKYFDKTQGWSREEVEAQVLTPIENGSLLGNPAPDPDSVMCYQLPPEILLAGAPPILGGADITDSDHRWAGKLYPRADAAPVELLAVDGGGEGVHGAGEARGGETGQPRRPVAVIVPGGEAAYVAALVEALR
ncbi:MAG: hypothetical protein JNK64_24270 [Myxococcales bacterium]|nr:hypothetical protein [Myxococcales bacterium]